MTYRRPPRFDDGRGPSYPRSGDNGGARDRDRDQGYLPRRYEDWAWGLDYLPFGYIEDPRPKHLREPVLQVIGEQYFSLLEIILDRRAADTFQFMPETRYHIGKGDENVVGHRFRRLPHDKLTINARGELPRILERIVHESPARFVEFYNKSQPLTNRMHQLELLPGIGKKTMWQILDARKAKLFDNFEDITNRASITKPDQLIIRRIIRELEVPGEKHLIFARP